MGSQETRVPWNFSHSDPNNSIPGKFSPAALSKDHLNWCSELSSHTWFSKNSILDIIILDPPSSPPPKHFTPGQKRIHVVSLGRLPPHPKNKNGFRCMSKQSGGYMFP